MFKSLEQLIDSSENFSPNNFKVADNGSKKIWDCMIDMTFSQRFLKSKIVS